jgi:hypothetical protein
MQSQFPTWVSQPGSCLFTFSVTGASVGSSAGTAGLDGRGATFMTISQTGNVFTVLFNSAFGDVPYIFPAPSAGQTDTLIELLTVTTSGFTYQAVESDSSTTPVVNPNVHFLMVGYNTTSFVA